MLKETSVELDGVVWTVKELPLSKSATIMTQLSDGDRFQTQIDLVLACTFDDAGNPINGDEVGLTSLETLAVAAMDVNGLGAGKG